MKKLELLTPEKLAEIYTSEKFRNNVAFAHKFADKNGNILGLKTCSYPVEYIVTPDQAEEANKERNRVKELIFNTHKNDLLFVGMGMGYTARYEGDVCNHRIRTEFVNKDGKQFFIEVGTAGSESMRCDHSIDRDLQRTKETEQTIIYKKINEYRTINKCNFIPKELEEARDQSQKQSYNNYKGLEHSNELGKYTLQNVLNLINSTFNCNFKNIVVDNYNIHCNDKEIICYSPKN